MRDIGRASLALFGAVFFICGLVACGGGGGGGDSDTTPGPSVSRTVTGAITGFGSVIVNGIEFETTGAEIFLEDQPGSESGLSVGMVVQVRGDVDRSSRRGTASRIDYEDDLQGPVDSTDPAAGTLVVMGVTVLFDDQTAWKHASPQTLAPGAVVEVSGHVANAAGSTLRARYIEQKVGAHDHEMRGFVDQLDPQGETFQLAGITVDYSGAALDDDIVAAGGLAEGMFVEVKADQPPVGGTLAAKEIELEDEYRDDSGDEVEVEGLVTRFAGAADFDVNGRRCTTTERTRYENGSQSDLALNARVEVEGEVSPDGVLVCARVKYELAKNIKIEGEVAAVDPAAQTITVLGTELIRVFVTGDTMLKIKDRPGTEHPTLEAFFGELAVGDWVKVHALLADADEDGIDDVVAHKVDLEDAKARVRLQGPVTEGSLDEAAATAEVLGITIDMSGATYFEDSDGTPIATLDAFVARLADLVQAGPVLLKAKGTFTPEDGAGTLSAVEVELEASHDLEHERDRDGSSHEFEAEDDGDDS